MKIISFLLSLILLPSVLFADCTNFSGTYSVGTSQYIWKQTACERLDITEFDGNNSLSASFITDGAFRDSSMDQAQRSFLHHNGKLTTVYVSDDFTFKATQIITKLSNGDLAIEDTRCYADGCKIRNEVWKIHAL